MLEKWKPIKRKCNASLRNNKSNKCIRILYYALSNTHDITKQSFEWEESEISFIYIHFLFQAHHGAQNVFFVLKLWQRQTTFFFCIKRKAYGLQTCIALLPCCFFLVGVDLSQGSSVKSACSEKLFVIHRCLGVAKLKLKHAHYSVMFSRSNFAQLKYTIVYTWIVLPGIQHDKIQGSFFTESFWRKKKENGLALF